MNKTTIVITLILFLILPVFAEDTLSEKSQKIPKNEFKIIMKNGRVLIWDNYTARGDEYCTNMYDGSFCIPKDQVVSIQKEIKYISREKEVQKELQKPAKEKTLTKKEKMRKYLSNCLEAAREAYEETWRDTCRRMKRYDDCLLPRETAKDHDLFLERRKKSCHRKYGSYER